MRQARYAASQGLSISFIIVIALIGNPLQIVNRQNADNSGKIREKRSIKIYMVHFIETS